MKRAFEVKEKAFFIIFKRLEVAENCIGPERQPLSKITGKYVFRSFFNKVGRWQFKTLLERDSGIGVFL